MSVPSASEKGSPDTRAVVVAHFGVALAVRLDDGTHTRVAISRRAEIVVGDRVRLGPGGPTALPASGVLRRRDTHGRVRKVAANLDVLGVVVAARPVSDPGFVDRAVVAARAADIEPVLVVNKCDQPGAAELAAALSRQTGGVLRCFVVSASRGDGLDTLRSFLAEGRRGAFVGVSGVGKSSLLNALCPTARLDVGEINDLSGLGRHVTSTATLHRLPDGGELIDTPGFRDFGPVEVSARDLADHFPGFEVALEEACRFRDCLHRSEPDCAVQLAVADGRLHVDRLEAYLELLDDLERAERIARGY